LNILSIFFLSFLLSLPYFVPCARSLFADLPKNLQRSGINRAMTASKQAADMGLWKKIAKLPFEMIRDWRRFNSIMGPRTKARMRGAMSYSNLRKK
jgi:hypothetical protein